MNQLDQILLERACQYGNFEDNAKRSARIYHQMVSNAPQFMTKEDLSIYYEALHMIAMKISRLVNGRINDPDGWQDIAGYAMLVHKHLSVEPKIKKNGAAVPDETILKNMEQKLAEELDAGEAPASLRQ